MKRILAPLIMSVSCSFCFAEIENSKRVVANKALRASLAAESQGIPVDRREGVPAEEETLSSTVRWQIGQIRHAGKWVNVEDISSVPPAKRLLQYQSVRKALSGTTDAHRELALWCEKHSLYEQAKAHWNGVLLANANDLQARQQLGQTWIAGQWYTNEEVERVAAASRTLQADLKKWMPAMRQVVSKLQMKSSRAKENALEKLDSIGEPSSIAALEFTCLQVSDDIAAPFIQAIARFRSKEACLACCRIAMEYPTRTSTEIAIAQLKTYPLEMYVPELLSIICKPIESEMEYFMNEKGEMLIRRAILHETMDQKQHVKMQRLVRVSPNTAKSLPVKATFSVLNGPTRFFAMGSTPRSSSPNDLKVDELAASRNALEEQVQLDRQIELANQKSDLFCKNTSLLLSKLTDDSPPSNPESLWKWWRDYNYRYSTSKPLQQFSYTTIDRELLDREYAIRGPMHQLSCLVAGTEIQTAEGLRAVDKIQIGDLVLAQDVESGELAFKPVLQTTVRPPTTSLRIVAESGEIQATAGHRWFVSGKGWLMTHQLRPNMLLHNARGTTRIDSVDPIEEPQKTFNLVVEEFHTYFVGKSRILSYDNTELKPTLRPVPGYGLLAKN